MTCLRVVMVMFLMLPTLAAAQGLVPFHGRWQGEGRFALGTEPEQRFRCQIRLEALASGQTYFSGRCATAQAAQSFGYRLRAAPDGALMAENASDTQDGLPQRLDGRVGAAGFRLEGGEAAVLDLTRLADGDLRFVIEGHDSRGPARGEALLAPRQ